MTAATGTEQVPASKVEAGIYVLDHEGNHVKVLASYRDGHGATACWVIEGYAEGKPTAHIRGAPDTLIDVVAGESG